MSEEYRNIYQDARRRAGITQEAAEELLGISVESIRAYETGRRVPPVEAVRKMMRGYNTPYLGYQHLRETDPLAAQLIPAVEPRSPLKVAVRFYNRMSKFVKEHQMEHLLVMAEDDLIDENEQPEFDAFMDELREMVCGYMELEMFRNSGPQG